MLEANLHGDTPFPASLSATYEPFTCTGCPSGSTCDDGKCVINIEYFDGSKVLTIVAMEDFTFASEGESSHTIKDIVFGCGLHMENFPGARIDNNKISGIMGMSNGDYGFMEQTKLMFNGNFSYCLQPLFRPGSSPMYLRFGNDVIPQPVLQMQATPIYKYNDQGVYHLHLEGISIDTQRLQIHPDIFKIKDDGTGGCVIDSGTAPSWIVTGAFDIFKDAVTSFIQDHNNGNWRNMAPPPELSYFNLCYQRYQLPKTIVLPKITFHFENNADFLIGVEESFTETITVSGKDIVCMQFFESTFDRKAGVTYLGSIQQANKRIVYDLGNSLLHFGPADCSNEN